MTFDENRRHPEAARLFESVTKLDSKGVHWEKYSAVRNTGKPRPRYHSLAQRVSAGMRGWNKPSPLLRTARMS